MTRENEILSLASLIEFLHKDISVINRGRMEEILNRLILSSEELDNNIHFSDQRYARNLVYKHQKFEIFLMCWKSGQRSLIHDHGRSLGGVKIVDGVLTESLFETGPNGMIKTLASAEYHPGNIQIEDVSLIHQVANLQADSNKAISLHIYAPPLTRMNIYSVCEPEARSGTAEYFNFGAGI